MFSGLTSDSISSPSQQQEQNMESTGDIVISPGTSAKISPMLLPFDFMEDDTYNDAYLEAFDPEAFARRELDGDMFVEDTENSAPRMITVNRGTG